MNTMFEAIPASLEQLAKDTVNAAFQVHKNPGPGLLESVYEVCLVHELHKCGLVGKRQLAVPVVYDDVRLETGLVIDLLVEDQLIVELKSVEQLLPVQRRS